MIIVLGAVCVALLLFLGIRGPRRHGPTMLLLGGVALGCFGLWASLQGAIDNMLGKGGSDGATSSLLLLAVGLLSILTAVILVVSGAVMAAKRDRRSALDALDDRRDPLPDPDAHRGEPPPTAGPP